MRSTVFLVLVCACANDPQFDGMGVSEKTYYYEGDWTYVGPGGTGAFTAMLVDPDDNDVIYAGSDVGGVYIFDQTATTPSTQWVNITGAMKDQPVADLAVAPAVGEVPKRLYIATSGGLYICDDPSPAGCASLHHNYAMGLPWTDYGDIFVTPNEDEHRAPVSAVAIDPADPLRVWVGLGHEPKPWKVDRYDYAKVMLSTNAGITFSPVLKGLYGAGSTTATATAPTSASYTGWQGTVFDIVLDPQGSGEAWVSTDYGLFYTDDDGGHWARMGLSDRYCTTDAGLNWVDSLTATTSTCYTHTWPALSTSGVLPTPSAGTMELRQMATSLETESSTASLVLYAVVWDNSYPSSLPSGCTAGDHFNDPSFTYYKGGAWRSEDRGATWTNLTNTTCTSCLSCTTLPCTYDKWPTMRCDSTAPVTVKTDWYATLFASIDVKPEVNLDQEPPEEPQVFLGGFANDAGLFRGQRSGGTWTWDYATNPTLEPCSDTSTTNCFEQDQSLGLTGATNVTPVYDIAVRWSDGDDPDVFAGHSHGGWRAEWTSTQYEFYHLGSTWNTAAWDSTGLDDACVEDVAAPLPFGSDDYALLGVMDDGLLIGKVGTSGISQWESLSNDWENAFTSWTSTDINSIAYDDGSITNSASCSTAGDEAAYVAHDQTAGDSVLIGDHTITSPWRYWAVIGGYGHGDESTAGTWSTSTALSAETDLPYATVGEVHSLAIDYWSCPTDRRVLAGTDQGLYIYTPGTGWGAASCTPYVSSHGSPIPLPAASGAGECVVKEVLTDPIHIENAWFVMNCADTNSADAYNYENFDGVYYLDLATDACYQVNPTSGTTKVINAPESLALSTSYSGGGSPTHYLLVGTRVSNRPYVYRTVMDPDAATTSATWSLALQIDSLYGTVPAIQDGALNKLRMGEIEMDPNHRNDVTAALYWNSSIDGHNPDFVVRTVNAGSTWQAIDPTGGYSNGLPSRRTKMLRFDQNGDWLYHGSCASLYRGEVN